MDPSTKLRFQTNLRNFSSVAIATTLWEHHQIKKEIKKYFHNWQSHIHDTPKEAAWQALVKKVSHRCDLLNLPEEQLSLVQNLIIPIGEKLFYWSMYVLWGLGLDLEFSYKIYWTNLGTIDEHKCYSKHWVKVAEKSRETLRLSCLPYDGTIFFLGCLFNEKGFLRAHLEQMRVETQLFLYPLKKLNSKAKLHVIIVIWLCVYFGKGKEEAIALYRKLKKSKTMDSDLFMMCLNDGLLEATKYFWSQLNQAEKKSVIMEGAEKCIRFIENDYSEEKCIEILMFLLNNMTIDERQRFCIKNFGTLIRFFMTAWPYQGFAEIIFDEFHSDDAISSKDAEVTLNYFLRRVTDSHRNAKFVNKDLCRRILKKVYEWNTPEKRIRILMSDENYILKLFQKFDIEVLTMILNDQDLTDHKEKILDMGKPEYKKLIKSKDFKSLDKFLQIVFDSESQKREFKLQISSLTDLLSEGNYKLADDVLNWLSDSAEERRLMKKQTDAVKICADFKNFKPELIEKLLLWQYETKEERKNAKEAMKENKSFISDKIIKIWNGNGKDSKRKCYDFLRWLGGSEERAIALKKNIVIDENDVKTYCETLPSSKNFKRIDELFEFLSLTSKQILEIKQKIVKDHDEWINNLIVNQKNFQLADALFNWIFRGQSQKQEVMSKYINSPKGAMLMVKTFLSCKVDQVEPLSNLLNYWVRSYGNFNTIKKKLQEIKPEGMGEFSAMGCLLFLVDLIKMGFHVSEHQINKLLPDESDSE